MTSGRRHAPATLRNREPILAVLRKVLPPTGSILEVASGSGEHAAYFAPALTPRKWVPSEPDPAGRDSIIAWTAETGAPLPPPLALDVSAPDWPVGEIDPPVTAVVAINLIHIAPWAAAIGLLDGAARLLPERGVLFLYGPYRIGGAHTAPSNAAFDEMLRAQNPAWGVRDLEKLCSEAEQRGLLFDRRVEMPANNQSVVFRRGPRSQSGGA